MALKVVETTDVNGFIDALQSNSPSGGSGGLDSNDSFITSPGKAKSFYYDRLDQVFIQMESSTGEPWARIDPLCGDLNYGPNEINEVFPDVNTGGPFQLFYFVGYNDLSAGVQRVYGVESTDQIFHVSVTDPFIFAVPSFSDDNWRPAGIFVDNSTGGQTLEGARILDGATASFIVFEEAEPETWPAGYMLGANITVRADDGSGLLNYPGTLCQIDLADEGGSTGPPGGNGRAVIIPTACTYDANPPAPAPHSTANAGPLGGFDMVFNRLQFAADPDSTPAAPKGRLFMFNTSNGAGNEHRTPQGAASAGTVMTYFVKVIEWNPTAKAPTTGNVNREHLREILISVMQFIEQTVPESGGIGLGVPGVSNADKLGAHFHPPTNTIRYYINTSTAAETDGNSTMIVFSLSPAVASLTVPTQIGQAETGKTTTFVSFAIGSIGERISGVDVDWTLDRTSTITEALTNPGPGGTVAVANFPIDGESPTVNSLTVFEDGVPLTVTSDYTVVLSTGAITGVGAIFDVTKTYTATYEHTTKAAQPSHAILRTLTSRTDNNGAAAALVEVPDDDAIAGQFDTLTSVEAP